MTAARRVVGRLRHPRTTVRWRLTLLYGALFLVSGAALLAIADAASRWLAHASRAETQLPVGVLTGLLGGPFFLLLLAQSRRRDTLPESEPAPAAT